MSNLDVFLNEIYVGKLSYINQKFSFSYDSFYLSSQSPHPLSQSLPLSNKSYIDEETRPFFTGLLPEGNSRIAVARTLGISELNDFRLLVELGNDCAGAVRLSSPAQKQKQSQEDSIRWLNEKEQDKILASIYSSSLAALQNDIRLSLAGAMHKLALCWDGKKLGIPTGNFPSTHILKPSFKDLPKMIENEKFCLDLARKVGIKSAYAEILTQKGEQFILIKRYDRIYDGNTIKRLHQEDFCQALGYLPEKKYQADGGPGFADCFSLLRRSTQIPAKEIIAFIDLCLFNLCIGNTDAHAKNFSLLYNKQGYPELAPAYDLLSIELYESFTDKPAMKWGRKQKNFDFIFSQQFDSFAEAAGVSSNSLRKHSFQFFQKLKATAWSCAEQDGSDIAHSIVAFACDRCNTLEKCLKASSN